MIDLRKRLKTAIKIFEDAVEQVPNMDANERKALKPEFDRARDLLARVVGGGVSRRPARVERHIEATQSAKPIEDGGLAGIHSHRAKRGRHHAIEPTDSEVQASLRHRSALDAKYKSPQVRALQTEYFERLEQADELSRQAIEDEFRRELDALLRPPKDE